MYLSQVPVPVAAKLIGTGEMTVRCGLRCGRLPIGTAIKCTGKTYRYVIVSKQLADYIGKPVMYVEMLVEKWKAKGGWKH